MRISRYLAVGAACTVGLTLGVGSPAFADYGPQPNDVVGVGSDTVQNIADFLADGDTSQDAGYNASGGVNRWINFSATADANDRAAYGPNTSTLNPTVILRAGTNPVKRINGSGAGMNALVADTASPEVINYVRSSSVSAITGAATVSVPLHAVKIATDDEVMAAASASTFAVPLSLPQLAAVYSCNTSSSFGDATDWHTFNASAPVGTTIIPLYPQSGSGTGKTFLTDLNKGLGLTGLFSPNAACAVQVEENDPASITGLTGTGPSRAIAPFSSGRKALFDSHYFNDPSVNFGGTAVPLSSGLTLEYGTQTANSCTAPASGQTVAYCDTRGLYIAFRQSDFTSTVKWQPGSTKNWVQTLFAASSGTPFVKSGNGQALIASGGVTPTYADCGVSTGGSFASPCV